MKSFKAVSLAVGILVFACATNEVMGGWYGCSFKFDPQYGICWAYCPSNDGRWCYTGNGACRSDGECANSAAAMAGNNAGQQCAAYDLIRDLEHSNMMCAWNSDSGCVNSC